MKMRWLNICWYFSVIYRSHGTNIIVLLKCKRRKTLYLCSCRRGVEGKNSMELSSSWKRNLAWLLSQKEICFKPFAFFRHPTKEAVTYCSQKKNIFFFFIIKRQIPQSSNFSSMEGYESLCHHFTFMQELMSSRHWIGVWDERPQSIQPMLSSMIEYMWSEGKADVLKLLQ